MKATEAKISKTVNNETTYFAYDKFGNVIAEYAQDGNNVVWQRNYIYGGGQKLRSSFFSSSQKLLMFSSSQNKSTQAKR